MTRLKSAGARSMTPLVGSTQFTFRLERVRSLRERAEDQAKEHLADGMRLRAAGEARLRDAADAARTARERTGAAGQPGGVSVLDLVAAQAWLERTEVQRQTAALELDRQDTEVEARRTALAFAAQEREAVERLERTARARHEADAARREQGELDEIALSMHRRGGIGAAA